MDARASTRQDKTRQDKTRQFIYTQVCKKYYMIVKKQTNKQVKNKQRSVYTVYMKMSKSHLE